MNPNKNNIVYRYIRY